MPGLSFHQSELQAALDALEPEAIDQLEFGLIGIDADGVVQRYNTQESSLSGLAVSRVIGRPLFTVVAPCMNNAIVAGRFDLAAKHDSALDVSLDYVLALRMRPAKVRLRLLAPAGHAHGALRYVLIQRLV